jgi:hypothetical protein
MQYITCVAKLVSRIIGAQRGLAARGAPQKAQI